MTSCSLIDSIIANPKSWRLLFTCDVPETSTRCEDFTLSRKQHYETPLVLTTLLISFPPIPGRLSQSYFQGQIADKGEKVGLVLLLDGKYHFAIPGGTGQFTAMVVQKFGSGRAQRLGLRMISIHGLPPYTRLTANASRYNGDGQHPIG